MKLLLVVLSLFFLMPPAAPMAAQEAGQGPVTGGSGAGALQAAEEFRIGVQA